MIGGRIGERYFSTASKPCSANNVVKAIPLNRVQVNCKKRAPAEQPSTSVSEEPVRRVSFLLAQLLYFICEAGDLVFAQLNVLRFRAESHRDALGRFPSIRNFIADENN